MTSPTSQAVTPTEQRVKILLSGDWTPYLKSSSEVVPYANTASGFGNPIASIDEWDWGLLRHDIHVLYHKAKIHQERRALRAAMDSAIKEHPE